MTGFDPVEYEKHVEYSRFTLSGETYLLGDAIYLPPDTYSFAKKPAKSLAVSKMTRDVSDATTYPELYRKSEYIKGNNDDVPKPFQIGKLLLRKVLVNIIVKFHIIGQIKKIIGKRLNAKDLTLTVEIFYRFVVSGGMGGGYNSLWPLTLTSPLPLSMQT